MSVSAPLPGRAAFAWDHPHPFTIDLTVTAADIDTMGHTNNVTYLAWLEQVAWAHSQAVGLDWTAYRALGVGCVARHTELDYLATSFAGDEVRVATWVLDNDGRLRLTRGYQVVRLADGRTLLRGRTLWVSVDLASGRPCRMPPEFVHAYAVTVQQP